MLDGAKVLVTGGAGFIGSALVDLLSKGNAEVVVVDNLVNGKRENIAPLLGDRVIFSQTDIRDTTAMSDLMDGCDVVFHLACLGVRHSIHDPLENHVVNADATLKMLMAARTGNVGRFVYVSSSEVYGTSVFTPMTEQHPTLTKTVYGGSKLAGESYTRAYYETYGYETVVVRPFNAFGPRSHHEGDSGEVIPKFMLRAMAGQPLVVFGDGTQTRDFTYVEDTARAIMMAGKVEAAVGQTINVGSGETVEIGALAHLVADVCGRDVEVVHDEPRPGDVLELQSDSSKARNILGYEQQVSLRDGLQRLKDWYATQGIDPAELLRDEITHNWVAGN